MEWSDKALVVGVGRFRETDMWLRLLTEQHGLMSVFAFGGSRSRKRFSGCLDMLNFLKIHAKTTRNGQYVALQESILLKGPQRLRTDRLRLGMFMNCVHFVEALGVPPENGKATLHMLGELHAFFEEAKSVPDALPLLFRLRMVSDQGYSPVFTSCLRCGTAVQSLPHAYFSVQEGAVLCSDCVGPDRVGQGTPFFMIRRPVLEFLQQILSISPKNWQADAISASDRRQCCRMIDEFIQYHVGLYWDKGRFQRH